MTSRTGGAEAPSATLTLRNDLRELSAVAPALEGFLAGSGATSWAANALHLIIEEIASNTIRYAWDDAAPHAFRIRLSRSGARALVEFDDDGKEFNPLDYRSEEPGRPLEERRGGGLGIHFVRSFAETCDYRRESGRNRLRITVDLTRA